MKPSRGEKVFNVVNILFLGIFIITIIIPLLFVLKRSLDASNQDVVTLSLIPQEFSLIYYNIILSDKGIFRPFLNSAYITIVGTVLAVFLSAMGAYSLSIKDLPGNKGFMFMIIFSMLFSGGLVPHYLLIKYLGLMNTFSALILPSCISGMNLILLRNYYNSIPASLRESATLDGAEEFTVFFRITLPLSAPIIAAIALFTGVGYWNTFFSAILYISDPTKFPFTVKLQEMIISQQIMQEQFDKAMTGEGRNNLREESVSAAMIIVSTIPIIIVYPFLQKHFTKGIMMGSVKG